MFKQNIFKIEETGSELSIVKLKNICKGIIIVNLCQKNTWTIAMMHSVLQTIKWNLSMWNPNKIFLFHVLDLKAEVKSINLSNGDLKIELRYGKRNEERK